jgi:hypothetical protein
MARSKTTKDTDSSSTLLITEYFDSGDPRFYETLLASTAARKLQVFAPRWYADRRKFARESLLQYIDDGCDRPHHRPVVKKIFKHAEAAADHEVMAHFFIVLDRMAPRVLVPKRSRRRKASPMVLRADPTLPAYRSEADRRGLFTIKTRRYLQRRVWRYFRQIGQADPTQYIAMVAPILAQYTDAQFEPTHKVLDCWSLVHALFWGNDALSREIDGARVRTGRSMSELTPQPWNEPAWALSSSFAPLFALILRGQSALVRNVALYLIKRYHGPALRRVPLEQIVALLKSTHTQAQTLSSELLENAVGLERFTLTEWLELLQIDNPYALPVLCRLAARHIDSSDITLEQCVALTCTRAAPVAELGLRWLRAQTPRSTADLELLMQLRNAPADIVRGPATEWLLGLLESSDFARVEHVRELGDSKHADVRERVIQLLSTGGRFADDPSLWSALGESPYDDVRAFLMRHLAARLDAFTPQTLQHLWATVLLSVHRGSRTKQAVLKQLSTLIVIEPDRAESIVPLLAIALRSVRAPERRGALAALTQAVYKNTSIGPVVAKHLPELQFAGA